MVLAGVLVAMAALVAGHGVARAEYPAGPRAAPPAKPAVAPSASVGERAFEARGCSLVEGAGASVRFPGPIDGLSAAPDGQQLKVSMWGLDLRWTPGLPAPGRGPIFSEPCGAAAEGATGGWQDQLLAAARLENAGDRAGAAAAWAAGVAGLRASGVRGDRVFSLPARALVPAAAVRRAIEAGDAEHVDLLLRRVADAFPYLGEGADVYPLLADWLRTHERRELAEAWDARARASAGAFVNDDQRAFAAIERLLPFAIGAYLALPLFGLLFGLGVGARAGRGAGPPGPLVLSVIGLGTMLFVAMILCASITGQLDVIGKHASAPAALLQDGMAAPEVKAWVDARVRPQSRAKLLANIDAERAAMQQGGRAELPPPSDDEMRQALAPTQGIGGRIADGAAGLRLSKLLEEDRTFARVLAPVDSLVRALLALLIAAAMGFAIGRAAPRAWRGAHLAIPGASRWLGPISGIVTMLALAAAVALVGGRLLAPIARLDLRPIFGLEGLIGTAPAAALPSSPLWVLPVLVAAIGVHVLGIWMDRRFCRIGGRIDGVDKPGAPG